MMTGSFNLSWALLALLVWSALAQNVGAAQKSFEKTRDELKAQGFKTDLGQFDFLTKPELRARETALNATAWKGNGPRFLEHPELLEPAGTNCAVVVWTQSGFKRPVVRSFQAEGDEISWDDLGEVLDLRREQLDAGCAAILEGPIQFSLDASAGSGMLLRHLGLLKNLTLELGDRVMLALHAGDRARAWTNLLAATRLVTQWNPEPVEISHRVRFAAAKLVFGATWQALNAEDWSDVQLGRLQQEWEEADYFRGLPEVKAFQRAAEFRALKQEEEEQMSEPGTSVADLEKEKDLFLHFHRDREVEYREAIKAKTWIQMRAMQGVTNEIVFEPKFHIRTRMQMNLRRITLQTAYGGSSFFGAAAEAEGERRILITAIAVERYRAEHKRSPEKLEGLSPEFLKAAPMDFMTGRPLHYRAGEKGRFSLYSVGTDGVDNGAKLPAPITPTERLARMRQPNLVPEYDLVWPLPASTGKMVALREHQARDKAIREAKRRAEMEAEAKATKLARDEARRAAMKKLLAAKPSLGMEPVYQGKPLSFWVDRVGQVIMNFGAPEDAVAAIRAIGAKAVPFLLEWMPHPGAEKPVEGFPDSSDLEIAWEVLGPYGKAAIPELARIINRPQKSMDDYSVWTHCAKAISFLGPDALQPMLTAVTNLQGKDHFWELLQHFENLGTNGAPAVPTLVRFANDSNYWVRAAVASALGGIGKAPDLAVPVLLNAVRNDADSMVRRDAASALGAFAADSEEVLSELKKTLQDTDWKARGGALSGLGKVQSKPDVVVPLIAPFLYDTNNVIQRSAAYALRDLGNEAGLRALIRASNAPSSWPGIGDIIYEVQEKSQRQKRK